MKEPLLALLARGPAHGYELKLSFDEHFGAVLPALNIGQVYSTLQRLERDGCIRGVEVVGDARGKRVYELTHDGRAELDAWVAEPVPPRIRDEFFVKLVLAGLGGVTSPSRLIRSQRTAHLRALRDIDEQRQGWGPRDHPVADLLLEGAALHIEADLRWLDLCEARLAGEGGDG